MLNKSLTDLHIKTELAGKQSVFATLKKEKEYGNTQ